MKFDIICVVKVRNYSYLQQPHSIWELSKGVYWKKVKQENSANLLKFVIVSFMRLQFWMVLTRQ